MTPHLSPGGSGICDAFGCAKACVSELLCCRPTASRDQVNTFSGLAYFVLVQDKLRRVFLFPVEFGSVFRRCMLLLRKLTCSACSRQTMFMLSVTDLPSALHIP